MDFLSFSEASLTFFLGGLFVIGFLAVFGFEGMTLYVRIAGAKISANAYASYLIMVLMLGNRVGAAILFPSGGAMIDFGITPISIICVFILSLLLLGLIFFLLVVFSCGLIKRVGWLFPKDLQAIGEVSVIAEESKRSVFLFWLSATIFLFHLMGIMAPIFGAAIYSDLRATIIQTGFLFNSVGTILNTLYIERRMAGVAERRPGQLRSLVNSIMLGKVFSLFLVAGLLTVAVIIWGVE